MCDLGRYITSKRIDSTFILKTQSIVLLSKTYPKHHRQIYYIYYISKRCVRYFFLIKTTPLGHRDPKEMLRIVSGTQTITHKKECQHHNFVHSISPTLWLLWSHFLCALRPNMCQIKRKKEENPININTLGLAVDSRGVAEIIILTIVLSQPFEIAIFAICGKRDTRW